MIYRFDIKIFFRKIMGAVTICLCLVGTLVLAGCSTTTLPWPTLSISHDEADEGLSQQEQSLLADLLASSQKNHKKEALKEIEGR